MRYLAGFVACLWMISAVAAESRKPSCEASIRGHSAAFWIEHLLGDKKLPLNESKSPSELQYQWSVSPGKILDNGQFQSSNYRLQFTVYRTQAGSPIMVSLMELFDLGEADALVKDYATAKPDGTVSAIVIPNARIKAGVIRNGVLLGTNDKSTFSTIFGDRPQDVLIVAHLPAAGAAYSCRIPIRYD